MPLRAIVYHPDGYVLCGGRDGNLYRWEAPRMYVDDPELVQPWIELQTGRRYNRLTKTVDQLSFEEAQERSVRFKNAGGTNALFK